MAEKLSDTIRRKVKGLSKLLDGDPKERSAPKASTGSSGTSDPATPASSPATPSAKPAKAKLHPWYRHRQRW